jgi:hypothetical protein
MSRKKINVVGNIEIKLKGDVDYILTGHSAWITVKNISVHLIKTEEGVVVDLYPLGREMDDCLSSTYAFDQEAQNAIDAAATEENS